MVSPIILTLVHFLHEIVTIIWIGGLLILVLVIMPVLKKQLKPDEFQIFNKKIRSRLSIFVYVSIVLLLVTGILLSNQSTLTSRLFSFENTYSILLSIKHILYFLMVAIAVFRGTILDRMKKMNKEVKQKLSQVLLLSNVIFAVAVLFLSSYLGVLASLAI